MQANSLTAKKTFDFENKFSGWAVFDGFMVAPIFKLILQGDRYMVADCLDFYHPLTFKTFTADAELFELRVLPEIRAIHEAHNADMKRECDADMETERAYIRHLETDPEAQAFRDYEDSRGVIQFGDAFDMAVGPRA